MIIRHIYPATHWDELKKFCVGKERDPKGCFRLSDDLWDASAYSANPLPAKRSLCRFRFKKLRSFIKPYAKSYCYRQLVENQRRPSHPLVYLPITLELADAYFRDNNLKSLDEIASSEEFAKFWEGQLIPRTDGDGDGQVSNWRQKITRPFWLDMSRRFGSPLYVPRIKYPKGLHPTDAAANECKEIPVEVTRQFKNKLGLHRDGLQRLNRYHHLRLCVLNLMICVGRRPDEVLTASRGAGAGGPLVRRPCAGGGAEGALWFSFRPNKGGPRDEVYVSPEWEDLATYCVRELLRYGDEVRHLAVPEERELLILVSARNWTAHVAAKACAITGEGVDFESYNASGTRRWAKGRRYNYRAAMLRPMAMRQWLYGQSGPRPGKFHPGVLEEWNITEDGSADGAVYKLRLLQARHSRQTALSSDPGIPRLVLQRDINHRERVSQVAYQHNLGQQHEVLKAKVRAGELVGNGLQWLQRILGVELAPENGSPGFGPGRPSILDERWRRLIEGSPLFLQFNRVPCGYCTLPQSPLACREYMNCTEAGDGGCRYFVTDPGNEKMVTELGDRADTHRRRQRESLAKGRTVQAGRHGLCAERTEDLRRQALVSIEKLKRLDGKT
jgi:hypothetical protein